jgi:hypothetical protein
MMAADRPFNSSYERFPAVEPGLEHLTADSGPARLTDLGLSMLP